MQWAEMVGGVVSWIVVFYSMDVSHLMHGDDWMELGA